jgi:hypothetical protein
LNVSADGIVSVGNLLRVWDGGTVNLSGGTLTADNIQHTDGGAFEFTGGTLHVETFTGNLTNSGGTLAPGAPVGTTTVTGNYAQNSGALQIELASPSSFDRLVVDGDLTPGGTLSVSLLNGYSPAAGATFDILNWATLTGTFSTLQLPPLSGSLTWNTTALYTDGVLTVAAAGLAGDYNFNGTVDAADYVVWRKTNGSSQAGYDLWRMHFGETAGQVGAARAIVPEPEIVLSLVIGITAPAFWRRGLVRKRLSGRAAADVRSTCA